MTRAPVRRSPLPDLLGRHDAPNGPSDPWAIYDVPMAPGFAKTSPAAREMFVPTHDNPQERVVRAHEMMHAKVSPIASWPEWVARGIASERSLVAAEEFRVNELLRRQGFDTKKSLLDGSEKFTGERVSAERLWADGVYMTAAFAGTARLRPFISGVRKHNPEWADAFRALDARLRAIAKTVSTPELASTQASSGLAPDGFAYTETWAVLLDLLAGPPLVRPARTPRDEGAGAYSESGDGERSPGTADTVRPRAPFDAAAIKRMTPPGGRGRARGARMVPWVPLRPTVANLDRLAPGGLGKTRRASDRGRHPRRIHRLLTDPHKRIFDATRRGPGGVVLIDISGSMSLEAADVLRIMEAAPGATVATYSAASSASPEPNLWFVANKGRMASRIPAGNGGNGCDGPALTWAINQRQSSTSPIVWVCDGIVTGDEDRLSDSLTLECINKVLNEKITMVQNVSEAVAALQTLAKGMQPPRWIPWAFEECWARITGTSLHP